MAEGDAGGARRWFGTGLFIIFALSGCSGLIYQSIWSQYLGLYLGHAAYAQSLVLAIFMGGMAIGAWWASRYSLKWGNLLRAYALVELVIGIAGALFHPIFLGVTAFAYDTAFPAMPGSLAVQSFKWVSGALLILPQAILLGTTFPLMSNGLMRRLDVGNGAVLGGLYFTNSIGAAFGALFATFMLLPAIGMPGAMRFGAILNIVVALIAFLMSREAETVPATATHDAKASRPPIERLLLLAAFVTGATSFVYEIGWIRMLSMAFGATVHAFELMLTAFIGGLAFGGLYIRKRADGYADAARAGGWVQVLMGLAALASLILYDHSFEWVAWFLRALGRTSASYDLYNTATAAVAMLIMAPAAFFAGMTLPLFTLALLRAGGGEASVGRIYATNTIGAIAGVFCAVHLLIPLLGLKLAMIIAAAGDLVLGVILLRPRTAQHGSRSYVSSAAISLIAVAITLFAARFDPAVMASGVYRHGNPTIAKGEQTIDYYRDGKTASIAVFYANTLDTRSIATNGKVDAGIRMDDSGKPSADEITMVLAGGLPLLYHPQPKSAAVIGFGSGLSTHALLGDPRLERVDTIEIEPAMVEGAKLFGSHVRRAYEDPRSHIHIEDAKTYFAANQLHYDIILSEPSNPWISGVSSLFSEEFYKFVPRHLNKDGLFVQWVQIYETNDELVGTIMRSLSQHFSDYRVYLANASDMLILARVNGRFGDMNEEALKQPDVQAIMKRVGVSTPADVLAHQLGDRKSLGALFDSLSRRVNSDFYPVLSLDAPRARFVNQMATTIYNLPGADLPYREVIGGLPAPRADQIELIPTYHYTARVHRAATLADSLIDDHLFNNKIDIADVQLLSYVREVAGRCVAPEDIASAYGQIFSAVIATTPYLDAERRRALWDKPAWVKCESQAPAVKAALDLAAAMARNDWAQVQQQASALLAGDRKDLTPRVQDWLLRTAMLGAIGSKDFRGAVDIDDKLGKDVPTFADTLNYLRYLRVYATRQAEGKTE